MQEPSGSFLLDNTGKEIVSYVQQPPIPKIMITLGSKVRITLTAPHLEPGQFFDTTVTTVSRDDFKVNLEGSVYYKQDFTGKHSDAFFINRGARYSHRANALIAYVHPDVEHPELLEPAGHEWIEWVEIEATIREIA